MLFQALYSVVIAIPGPMPPNPSCLHQSRILRLVASQSRYF